MIASPAWATGTKQEPIVFVVDDDVSVRDSLEMLIRDAGWRPQIFASAHELLAHPRVDAPNCLILDVSLPDLSGLDLQTGIAADQPHTPIIFLTGHGDVPMSVRAMKAGAFEFLIKPVSHETLRDAIGQAIDRSQTAFSQRAEMRDARDAYASLTIREREIMAMVVAGRLNKQIAGQLGISVITVKAHRGRMMRKMQAESVADLVRLEAALRTA